MEHQQNSGPTWVQQSLDPDPSPVEQYTRVPSDQTLAILLPLLILLSSLLFLLLLFLLFILLARRKRRIELREDDGPLDLGREADFETEDNLRGLEQRWLASTDEASKYGYLRAKAWQHQHPPNSQPTDITLSQFLSIQEKGVSAWSFEPDYEENPPLLVQSRTEIIFLADGVGLPPEEGGAACVQSNLPLPKINEVYYWEAKLFEKPVTTNIAVGLATKPYPSFRLPGWNQFSIGYFSEDGFKSHNFPFTSTSYGSPLLEGDVIGIGYRPRTGAVFFTKNGRKLEDAYVGLNRYNLFPTVGASGAATIHVNLGQAGFVFIEANVKKWGLAPTVGTLAPPPAYGSERGSILLEAAAARDHASLNTPLNTARELLAGGRMLPGPRSSRIPESLDRSRHLATPPVRVLPPPSDDNEEMPLNPPTPNLLDISLRALHRTQTQGDRNPVATPRIHQALSSTTNTYDIPPPSPDSESVHLNNSSSSLEDSARPFQQQQQQRQQQPPAYNIIDPNTYAPGVAEAMLGDEYQRFLAAQQLSQQSNPSSYEDRTSPRSERAYANRSDQVGRAYAGRAINALWSSIRASTGLGSNERSASVQRSQAPP